MSSLVLIWTGLEMQAQGSVKTENFNEEKFLQTFFSRVYCYTLVLIPGLNSWQCWRLTYNKWVVWLNCATQRMPVHTPALGVVTESGLQRNFKTQTVSICTRAQGRLEAQQLQGSEYQRLNKNASPFSGRKVPKVGAWMKGVSQANIQVEDLRVDQRRLQS